MDTILTEIDRRKRLEALEATDVRDPISSEMQCLEAGPAGREPASVSLIHGLFRSLTAPTSPAKVKIGQVVVLEADPHKRIEICQPIEIRDSIVVRFELAEVPQACKMTNRLELVVADVEPLET